MLKWWFYSMFFYFFCLNTTAQNTSKNLKVKAKDSIVLVQGMDILAPSKAAFYSAVLPGLGQAYNKKYWKVPLVWGAMGTSGYFYFKNNDDFKRYRTAFKLRQSGRPDEFDGSNGPLISDTGLRRAQEVFKKNRDLSLFITLGFYILNIIEANVDAHLPDKALDTNITFNPTLFTAPVTNQTMVGATISFSF
jgi:hypothetical protein